MWLDVQVFPKGQSLGPLQPQWPLMQIGPSALRLQLEHKPPLLPQYWKLVPSTQTLFDRSPTAQQPPLQTDVTPDTPH
jgi:hypothetical protein